MCSLPWLRLAVVVACSVFLTAVIVPVHGQVSDSGGSADARPETSAPAAVSSAQPVALRTSPLPAGTRFIRTVVIDGVIVAEDREGLGGTNADTNITAPASSPLAPVSIAGEERLIYSNTLGRVAVDFGANRLISDDITTTALSGCALSRFSFDVDGRVNEALAGGPYSVEWGLYTTCPYSVIAGPRRDARRVTYGTVQAPDDAPRTIEVVFDPAVAVPTHLWLGLKFSRANAGAITGAPAMVGFSGDVLDYPGSACDAYLGGFPTQPHSSFNVQMWGVGCPEVNLKYQSTRESGAAINEGANEWITDDVTLSGEPCWIRGYAVGVRGPAVYDFELRESCGGPVIEGTRRTQVVDQSSLQEPRVFEYTFDPPILVPREFAYAVRVNNNNAGPILHGPTSIPFSGGCPESATHDDACTAAGALHFAVFCDGPAPVGACCDMFITQCVGGPLDGEACNWATDCAPGTCESVCRDVPQLNCPYPPPCTWLQPAWHEGRTCASDADPDGAFPAHVCGQSACCTPDDTCLNLTKNECEAYPPIDEPRQWQRGRFCGENEQYCPFAACLGYRDADVCYSDHDEPGCSDSECCHLVCSADPWCCRVEWDLACVEWEDRLCYVLPANDSCGPTPNNSRAGATPIGANSSVTFTNRWAGWDEENRTSCTLLSEYRCVDDGGPGSPCEPGEECTFGTCELYDWPAFNTVWFKFTATHSSAQIGTCRSPTALDASIHVFAGGDLVEDEAPCDHLSLVSCTAADGCGTTEQACLCVEGLTVGEEYYIMVGSSSADAAGVYQLDITSPCDGARCCPRNDCNDNCVNDLAETTTGESADCDGNSVPDECDFDCDSDGRVDTCERRECFCPFECDHYFDADFNCAVDLRDFAQFQNCFLAPTGYGINCCYMMDAWRCQNGTVDLTDYYDLYVGLRGAGVGDGKRPTHLRGV